MSGFWRPAHGSHAIEAVALIVFFNSDLPPMVMKKIRDLTESAVRPLGLTEQRPLYEVEIGVEGAGIATQSEAGRVFLSVDGLTEAEVAAGQFKELLSVEKNSIGYRNASYTTWTEVRDRFFSIMDQLVPVIQDVMALAKIRFEYTDRFAWEGNLQEADNSALLRPSSIYVTPHVYASPRMWHCHTGTYLEPQEAGRPRVLQIHMQSARWKAPGSGADENSGVVLMTAREDRFEGADVALSVEAYNMLKSDLDQMHVDLIQAISEVISDPMLSQIGLKAHTV